MSRLFFLILFLVCSCHTPSNMEAGWQKVFQNDATGKTVFGEKSQLIEAVRLGYPVRMGWGGMSVEHVADADFLTIFQGEEVFAQIKTIVGQEPQIIGDSLKIKFRPQNHWIKIAGTNGHSVGLMTDYMNDSIVGGGEDRYTATTWYVLYPQYQPRIEAKPLWRKESPHWKKID